jgi:two-component system, OmpR family, phosphate regulon sensor histidine kinase PhoR
MTWRLATFLACQVGAGGIGWWAGEWLGAAVGLVLGPLAWLAIDSWRGARVLRWLRAGDSNDAPLDGGFWGEVAQRVRRGLRRREQQADDAQHRLQEFLAAIQASPNGVVLLDAQGRIEWCNQTAAGHLGIDPQRDLMQQVGNLVRDPAFTAYYNAASHGQHIVIPGPASSPSRPVKLSLNLHAYGQGRRLLLSRDVTALEQAEAMRRDFVANVSHEIRTPLTVLAGFVETLQQLPLAPQERARYLDLMAQQAQRMQTLVSDLLTLSRMEGSPTPGLGEWTGVGAFNAQCEHEARSLCDALGKTLDLRFAAAPALEIAGSASELLSAMSNLVSNAVRYTQDGGTVDVMWRELPEGRAEFIVHDTGPGIAAEHLSRLTERFYRIDRSRSRETGGTGLGLAIVKHAVQRHGAELKIESAPGAGSTFAIQFPASRLRGVKPGTRERSATESLAGSS